MRLLYIGPSEFEDKEVNAISLQRTRIGKYVAFHDGDDAPQDENEKIYAEFLTVIEQNNELIEDISVIYPGYDGEVTESTALDGQWAGIQELQTQRIPALRRQIERIAGDENEKTVIHVDLGYDLLTLYAAYLAVMMGYPTMVTFHAHMVVKEDGPAMSFAIGGGSFYAKTRPLLRRALALKILAGAQHIFVPLEGVAECLAALFPENTRPYSADPLFPLETQADVVPEADLPSHIAPGEGNG